MFVVRLWVFLVPVVVALHYATRKVASLLEYDASVLGAPLMLGGKPYYMFWHYPEWWMLWHKQAPQLFKSANAYILVGLLIGVLFLWLLRTKPELTTHGSQRWADYDDLLKMQFISAHGVVIGLYDSWSTRFFARFLRKTEKIDNEKMAFGELRFDEKKGKILERLEARQDEIKDLMESTDSEDEYNAYSKRYMSLSRKIARLQELKYDPKLDYFTVYPWHWLRGYVLKIYQGLKHFYLRDNSDKHLIVVAPTRSGKGVGLILTTLLGSWVESVIVNDIKSENWGITAGFRKRMGQLVVKFEPTADDGSTARWNPLEEIQIGTPLEVSQTSIIASILADYEGKGKLDHWGANAQTVITAVILHLIYAHYADPETYPKFPNLSSVANFLKANILPKVDKEGEPVYEWVDPETGDIYDTETEGCEMRQAVEMKSFIDTVAYMQSFEHVPDEGFTIRSWNEEKGKYEERLFTPDDLKAIYTDDNDQQKLSEMPNVHPRIQAVFADIVSKPENECGSIISTANTALKEYLDPVLSRNTSCCDFRISDLMNNEKPMSLYLVTPPSDILRLAPIFRMFVEMMINRNTKKIGVYKKGRAKPVYKHRLLLLFDEFSAMGNLKNFVSALSFIAGYGMKAFLILQGIPQMASIYGKDNQILMNMTNRLFYAPNDNDTAEYISKMIGNKTELVETVSQTDGWLSKENRSKAPQARPLITADELSRLDSKEVIMSGSHPVLTDKARYYEDDFFLRKLFDAPVASDVLYDLPYPERDALLASEKGKRKMHKRTYEEIHVKYKDYD